MAQLNGRIYVRLRACVFVARRAFGLGMFAYTLIGPFAKQDL